VTTLKKTFICQKNDLEQVNDLWNWWHKRIFSQRVTGRFKKSSWGPGSQMNIFLKRPVVSRQLNIESDYTLIMQDGAGLTLEHSFAQHFLIYFYKIYHTSSCSRGFYYQEGCGDLGKFWIMSPSKEIAIAHISWPYFILLPLIPHRIF
jgi:hypothetical protein